jgi:hypothetical protein
MSLDDTNKTVKLFSGETLCEDMFDLSSSSSSVNFYVKYVDHYQVTGWNVIKINGTNWRSIRKVKPWFLFGFQH